MAGSKWRALCPETPASVMPPTCLCHSDVPLLLPPKSETRACPVISGAGLLRQPHGCAGLTPDPKQVAFPWGSVGSTPVQGSLQARKKGSFMWLELLLRMFMSVLSGDGGRRKGLPAPPDKEAPFTRHLHWT